MKAQDALAKFHELVPERFTEAKIRLRVNRQMPMNGHPWQHSRGDAAEVAHEDGLPLSMTEQVLGLGIAMRDSGIFGPDPLLIFGMDFALPPIELHEHSQEGDRWNWEHALNVVNGSKITIMRARFDLVPEGYRWIGHHVSSMSPTNREATDPKNWERNA
jgi:hypothetical protein